MNIEIFSHDGPGVVFPYDRDGRIIGMKNYGPANNLLNITKMERHQQTEEQFLLFQGSCTIVTFTKNENVEHWELTLVKPGSIYNIPKGLWHTTIMSRDCRMVLVENSGTSTDNSEYFSLTKEQCSRIRELYKSDSFSRQQHSGKTL